MPEDIVFTRHGAVKMGLLVEGERGAAMRELATRLLIKYMDENGIITMEDFSAFLKILPEKLEKFGQGTVPSNNLPM
jgi:intergrase/recombinase